MVRLQATMGAEGVWRSSHVTRAVRSHMAARYSPLQQVSLSAVSLFNILITSSIVPHYIHSIHIVVAQHAAKRLESVWTFISLRSRRVVVYDVIFFVQHENKLRSKKKKKKNFLLHIVHFLKISDIPKKPCQKTKKKKINKDEKQLNISKKTLTDIYFRCVRN